MQSRPTFSPFEVEGKLLRDSPLEETQQYGEHQQTKVHTRVRIMFNPNKAHLHSNIHPPLICAEWQSDDALVSEAEATLR